jgi:hypothetical protein
VRLIWANRTLVKREVTGGFRAEPIVRQSQPKLPTETDRQFFWRNGSAVALIVFFLLVNVMLSWFLSSGTNAFDMTGCFFFASLGILIAQIVLLGLMLALFHASLLFRILTVTTAAVAICLSILFGEAISGEWRFNEVFKFDALPVVLLSFSVPFLLARQFMGWTLEFTRLPTNENSKLSVAGLLVATAVVAIAVSMLSFGDERLLMLKLIVAAGCTGASFVVFVPMTHLLMMSHRNCVWMAVFTIVPFSIGWAILWNFAAYLNTSYPVGIRINISIATLIVSFGIGILVLQRCGAQLKTQANEST